MTSTSRTSNVVRSHRMVRSLVLPLAALSLVLSACAPSGPGAETSAAPSTESTGTEITVQPSSPASDDPTSAAPTSPAADPTASPTADSTPQRTASTAASADAALLTISIQQDASAEPMQYVLECVDGAPGPASTLPGSEAACARLVELGTDFFTARPEKDIICTQQYGGPQTASITGDFNGTSVLASFALTDGCEISRWKKVQDILGAPGAQ